MSSSTPPGRGLPFAAGLLLAAAAGGCSVLYNPVDVADGTALTDAGGAAPAPTEGEEGGEPQTNQGCCGSASDLCGLANDGVCQCPAAAFDLPDCGGGEPLPDAGSAPPPDSGEDAGGGEELPPGTCLNNKDCPEGEICQSFKCVPTGGADAGIPDAGIAQPDGGVKPDAGLPDDTDGGGPDGKCKTDADCEPGLVCGLAGFCRPPEGGLQVAPAQVDFGQVPVGSTSQTIEVEVKSTALKPITILNFAFEPGSDPVFAIRYLTLNGNQIGPNDLPLEFARTDSLVFGVVCTPNDEKPDQATLAISNDSPDPVLLVAMADVVAGTPDIAIERSGVPVFPQNGVTDFSFGFGDVLPGNSRTEKFTVRNLGDGNLPLVIADIDFLPGSATSVYRFLVNSSGTLGSSSAPYRLNPKEALDIFVSYTPTSKGNFGSEIELRTNDPDAANPLAQHGATGGPGKVKLKLTGSSGVEPPRLAVQTASVDFGRVELGVTKEIEVKAANLSTDSLLVLDAALGAASLEFEVMPPSQEIPAKTEGTVKVSFTPSLAAPYTNDLVLHANDPEKPEVRITLAGTGISAGIVVAPQPPVFLGAHAVGTPSPPQKIEIKSRTPSPVAISGAQMVPGDTGFTIVSAPTFPAQVTDTKEAEIYVSFKPAAQGKFAATLVLAHPALSPGSTAIELRGESSGCAAGQVDLDKDPANGCEYKCTFSSASDDPELDPALAVDANCDGIDGNAMSDIFVSPNGADTNAGTPKQPKRTIAAAIAAAALLSPPGRVLATGGEYAEGQTLELQGGVSIHGGYDPSKAWARTNASFAIPEITVNNPLAARAVGLSRPTRLNQLILRAADGIGAGGPSVALLVRDSANQLALNRVTLHAGAGAAGGEGANGLPAGESGSGGGAGVASCEVPGFFCFGCSRPQPGAGGDSACKAVGGAGGASGSAGGETAQKGQDGVGVKAGSGGAAGSSGSNYLPGSDGKSGGGGANGPDGSGGDGFGVVGPDSIWRPSNGTDGAAGQHGSGGGGGGGGGGGDNIFCYFYGGAGGGGGGGGCGGGPGRSGGGGGASFGLLTVGSSVTVTQCTIHTGLGGKGGKGGTGGNGSNGGPGGAGGGPNTAGAQGGFGGAGGNGGRGGHGGGGGGGPSYCIVAAHGGGVTESGNTCNAGTGGAGGVSPGAGGANGERGEIRVIGN